MRKEETDLKTKIERKEGKEREKIEKGKGKEIRNKKEEKLHFKKCLISKILKLPINSNL